MGWLSVDPGEDTGWAYWNEKDLVESGTCKLWDTTDHIWEGIEEYDADEPFFEDGDYELKRLIAENGLETIVCEDFRIYPWKAKDLANDQVRTARLIGALTFICRIRDIPFVLQGAKIKERAEAGGAVELFSTPLHENRHANDAIRHGIYYIQKGPEEGSLRG